MKANAKLAIRVAILVVGMVATAILASTQPISVADGGPIGSFLCPPHQTCQNVPPPPHI